MAELFGAVLGGWLWVAIGRAVASQFAWDRAVIAGGVAAAIVCALFYWGAQHSPLSADHLVAILMAQALSVAFWTWRYAVNLRREELRES